MERLFYFIALVAAGMLMAGCTKEDVIDPVDVPDPLGRTVLVDGERFAEAIPNGATQVLFIYGDNSTNAGTLLSLPGSERPVYGNLKGTVWIVSTAATTVYANADCGEMFSQEGGNMLTRIDFGEGFNTSEVTDMSEMFEGCSRLVEVDFSMFNTAMVTDMSGMFEGCGALERLDLSSFNTASVTDMGGMFEGCSRLGEVNVASFNTARVTDMSGMFYGCGTLESLDLSSFNTAKVTDMSEMFYDCAALDSLDISSFNTAKVTDMSEMFYDCVLMTDLNLYNFSMSGITNAEQLKDFGHNLAGESGSCCIHSTVEVCAKMMMHGGLPGWVTFRWETH